MYVDTDEILCRIKTLEESLDKESTCMYDPTESYRVGYIQGKIDELEDLLERQL